MNRRFRRSLVTWDRAASSRCGVGGRDIADEDKAAIEAMVQKKGGDDGHWLDDDGENDDDEYDAKSDEDEDDGRHVSVKMDGWDDDESASDFPEEDVTMRNRLHILSVKSARMIHSLARNRKRTGRAIKSTAMSPRDVAARRGSRSRETRARFRRS